MYVNCAFWVLQKDNVCIEDDLMHLKRAGKNYVFFSRYLTYMGLCIATCIILNKNTYLAASSWILCSDLHNRFRVYVKFLSDSKN
ncbi:hypothetical protein NQ318_006850 [Aromia moschata]|uniref:Uncharacterized protein n=1 Tax=Aromia moschata TaxID=1265417 RepID=A0AAV8YKG9_9CUCU|nr:hypothetical protein NQ318_006850 [Aromia moschata]